MAKADEKVCTYEPKKSAHTSQKSLHTRAKKVGTHEPKVQTNGVYPDFLSISLLGGGKLTNSTLLTTMVVLFQKHFSRSSSFRRSYLNLSNQFKTCEKTYARTQYTPHLMCFTRYWDSTEFCSRNQENIPAPKTAAPKLLSFATCTPFFTAAGLGPVHLL